MPGLPMKKLEDFTDAEIKRFNLMHAVLIGYNDSIGTNDELPLPSYTDEEMAEYSGYRELVITKECED